MAAARVLVNACSIVVFGAFLLGLSWRIAAAAAVGSAALFLALHRLRRRARELGERTRGVNHGLAERTLVVLQGMRTIRAFAQEARYQAEFERTSAAARRTGFALERLHAMVQPATEVGHLALLCAIVAAAGAGGTPFATTLASVALLYRLQPHVRELEGHLLHLAGLEPALRSVLAMLDRPDEARPSAGSRPFPGLRDAVRFEDVTFAHPGAPRPALARASFAIPAGATTAIVGGSGAGKSTIVNLLLRLYAPRDGRILADGVPLEELSRTGWLARVAVAGQDVELVEGTVGENIRLARPEADDAGCAPRRRRPARSRSSRPCRTASRVDRAAGAEPLGRAAAAHRHRPRGAARPRRADPRRGHERPRRRARGRDPRQPAARLRRADARAGHAPARGRHGGGPRGARRDGRTAEAAPGPAGARRPGPRGRGGRPPPARPRHPARRGGTVPGPALPVTGVGGDRDGTRGARARRPPDGAASERDHVGKGAAA